MKNRNKNTDISVQAIAGTHSILLGMNATPEARHGLLGFAIKRIDHTEHESCWFRNTLTFAESASEISPNEIFSSYNSPIQKFLWGDYSAKPDHNYTYHVVPVCGEPKRLQHGTPVEINISTESESSGKHAVYFNRGVAASQAYVRKFGNRKPDQVENKTAWKWLSRGLEEAMIDFIEQAEGKNWKLYACVYEFQYAPVLDAFRKALDRGVDVQIIFDSKACKSGPCSENEKAIHNAGLDTVAIPRQANKTYISHNKFILLIKDEQPLEVWTGSTNITVGGIFGHSNVGHIVRDKSVASAYLAYWQRLYGDPTAVQLRPQVEELTPLPSADEESLAYLKPIFSPRKYDQALNWYAEKMQKAESSVFMTAAFGLNKCFSDVLKEKEHLAYIMLDKRDNDLVNALKHDDNVCVAFGALLSKKHSGGFLAEALTGLNEHVPYLHTKYMLVDALSEAPMLITGSANFSEASTKNNDENMLLIHKDTRVADIYLCEYMRLFEHFEFRDYAPASSEMRYLAPSDHWTNAYYKEGGIKQKQRLLFA